jgi:hypothetical protein
VIDCTDPCVNAAMADSSAGPLRLNDHSPEKLREVFQIGGLSEDVIGADEHFNWPNVVAVAAWLVSISTLLILAAQGRKALSVSLTPPTG